MTDVQKKDLQAFHQKASKIAIKKLVEAHNEEYKTLREEAKEELRKSSSNAVVETEDKLSPKEEKNEEEKRIKAQKEIDKIVKPQLKA